MSEAFTPVMVPIRADSGMSHARVSLNLPGLEISIKFRYGKATQQSLAHQEGGLQDKPCSYTSCTV